MLPNGAVFTCTKPQPLTFNQAKPRDSISPITVTTDPNRYPTSLLQPAAPARSAIRPISPRTHPRVVCASGPGPCRTASGTWWPAWRPGSRCRRTGRTPSAHGTRKCTASENGEGTLCQRMVQERCPVYECVLLL